MYMLSQRSVELRHHLSDINHSVNLALDNHVARIINIIIVYNFLLRAEKMFIIEDAA